MVQSILKKNKKLNQYMQEQWENSKTLQEKLSIINQYENLTGTNATAGGDKNPLEKMAKTVIEKDKVGEKVLEELETQVLKDIKIKDDPSLKRAKRNKKIMEATVNAELKEKFGEGYVIEKLEKEIQIISEELKDEAAREKLDKEYKWCQEKRSRSKKKNCEERKKKKIY